jgi:hypothetical protein
MLPVHSFSRAGRVEHVSALLAEPPHSSLLTLAWGPPAWDDAAEPTPDWDLRAQPEPDIEFDQRVSWQPPSSATEGAAAPDLTPARCAWNLVPTPAEARFGTLEISATLSALSVERYPPLVLAKLGALGSQRRLQFLSVTGGCSYPSCGNSCTPLGSKPIRRLRFEGDLSELKAALKAQLAGVEEQGRLAEEAMKRRTADEVEALKKRRE